MSKFSSINGDNIAHLWGLHKNGKNDCAHVTSAFHSKISFPFRIAWKPASLHSYWLFFERQSAKADQYAPTLMVIKRGDTAHHIATWALDYNYVSVYACCFCVKSSSCTSQRHWHQFVPINILFCSIISMKKGYTGALRFLVKIWGGMMCVLIPLVLGSLWFKREGVIGLLSQFLVLCDFMAWWNWLGCCFFVLFWFAYVCFCFCLFFIFIFLFIGFRYLLLLLLFFLLFFLFVCCCFLFLFLFVFVVVIVLLLLLLLFFFCLFVVVFFGGGEQWLWKFI